MLSSFHSTYVKEDVLSGGPWFVGGHIIGMEEWNLAFSTLSMKNLILLIWF